MALSISPSVVADSETLVRVVLEIDFDSDSQTVKGSLFVHARQRGMSTTRLEQAGKEALAKQEASKPYVG